MKMAIILISKFKRKSTDESPTKTRKFEGNILLGGQKL